MPHEETCIDCRPRRRNIDRIEFREEALRAAGIRRWACGQRSEHDEAAHRFSRASAGANTPPSEIPSRTTRLASCGHHVQVGRHCSLRAPDLNPW